jgi:hypothetical protein
MTTYTTDQLIAKGMNPITFTYDVNNRVLIRRLGIFRMPINLWKWSDTTFRDAPEV